MDSRICYQPGSRLLLSWVLVVDEKLVTIRSDTRWHPVQPREHVLYISVHPGRGSSDDRLYFGRYLCGFESGNEYHFTVALMLPVSVGATACDNRLQYVHMVSQRILHRGC